MFPGATSRILGIDIRLQPFLIILGVSQNQSRLQRAKGQLLSYARITERKWILIFERLWCGYCFLIWQIFYSRPLRFPLKNRPVEDDNQATSDLLPTTQIHPSILFSLLIQDWGTSSTSWGPKVFLEQMGHVVPLSRKSSPWILTSPFMSIANDQCQCRK